MDKHEIDWSKIEEAIKRGEDVEEQLDEIAGTGLKDRDPEVESEFQIRRERGE